MLDLHTREHGYTEVLPPFLVNSAALFGTGQLPKFAQDLFRCEGDWTCWLSTDGRGAGDQPPSRRDARWTTSCRSGYTAYTPCFRSEAGATARDVRGIIRQHQFQKGGTGEVAPPEQSYAELEALTADAETHSAEARPAVPDGAAVHRRYGLLVGQDVRHRGLAAGQNGYNEISSCSNFEAFQAGAPASATGPRAAASSRMPTRSTARAWPSVAR